MLVLPVRHHSPTAARQVAALIAARRPRLVLVEGPADATPLIPHLLDPDTVPPVAVYAWRTDAEGQATYYPLCGYSPEYVALRAGQQIGARLAFCDLPAGEALAHAVVASVAPDDAPESPVAPLEVGWPGSATTTPAPAAMNDDAPTYAEFAAALTHAAGFESFEAFWEAAFEQDAAGESPARYAAILSDYGSRVRDLRDDDLTWDRRREQHMAATALAAVAEGMAPEQIVLVCGAAHAEAIGAAFQAGATPPALTASPATLALIAFSYPRISEQAGYGAGNRAPRYYQIVWEHRGDYARATRAALLRIARELRPTGQPASLAQSIDAAALAELLARLRDKQAPGLDELTDAAIACLGQGQAARVSAALQTVLVGDSLGRVTEKVGRTPLQAEFYATAARLRLPVLDAPRQVLLHLADPFEREQSAFLHRLATADVAYGALLQGGLGGGRPAQRSALQQLGQVREKWELQWSPATDARLVERTAWGSTLAEVCRRLLDRRLAQVERVDEATALLSDMALCDLPTALQPALTRCDALAADSASFAPLAQAAIHLADLLAYGAARALPVGALTDLAAKLYARAAIHLPAAAACGDDATEAIVAVLPPLCDLNRRGAAWAAAAALWQALATVAERPASHARLRGLALVLLELNGQLAQGELAARLGWWLAATASAVDNAQLVAGLFALHRPTLLRNRALIGAITEFLEELSIEALTPLLPVLRRGLGNLAAAERDALAQTLAGVLGIDDRDGRRALHLSGVDMALLVEIDAAVAATLRTWSVRYGL